MNRAVHETDGLLWCPIRRQRP